MSWLRAYLAVPFKVLALLIRIYMYNRAWLEARLSRRGAAGTIKGILIGTVVAWFLVWMFANDDLRDNFNQALESWWSDYAR